MHTRAHALAHAQACLHVCMCVCVYVEYELVRTDGHVCVYVEYSAHRRACAAAAGTQMHTRAHALAHAQACLHVCMCVCVYVEYELVRTDGHVRVYVEYSAHRRACAAAAGTQMHTRA